jgi:subtilisin family serine protease
MKFLIVLLALASLSAAKILKLQSMEGIIPGKFIIKLKDGVDANAFIKQTRLRNSDSDLVALSDNVGYVYDKVFSGFSAALDDTQLHALDAQPEIDWIEPDVVMTAYGQTQTGAVWGLARTSSRSSVSGSGAFYYRAQAGTGRRVYVIDTGVRIAHNDFSGRASHGYNAVTGETSEDGNGHGTHVAGTCAGTTYGVAKRATIVNVKVLSASGSGTNAGVVAGVNYAASNCRAGDVINMSLGGAANTATDTAVNGVRSAGCVAAVAAGNSNANCANYSPARASGAFTVAASDVSDRSASFTNFGSCVKVYAPGVSITSAWYTSNTATNSISGTSMASPHVAGLAAYVGSVYGYTTPTQIENQIVSDSTSGAISGVPSGTVNRVIYNGGNGIN